MNAIELLKTDHKELQKLMDEIENTSARAAATRLKLFEKAKASASVHEKAEEKYLYPHLLAKKEYKLDALEHKEEVTIMSRLLKELSQSDLGSDEWMAKFRVFKELTNSHIDEEENEFFPEASKILSKEQLEIMGDEMSAYMNKELAKISGKKHG